MTVDERFAELDPLLPAIGRDPVVIVADREAEEIVFLDAARPASPAFRLAIPGVRAVAAYWTQ